MLLQMVAERVLKNRQLASPDLRRLFTAHIHDLVALSLTATRDAANIAYGRGMRAARLQAAKAFITRNIRRADLSAKPWRYISALHPATFTCCFKLKACRSTNLSSSNARYALMRCYSIHGAPIEQSPRPRWPPASVTYRISIAHFAAVSA
jgi:hypothetical protein